jgi:hypothetical protein
MGAGNKSAAKDGVKWLMAMKCGKEGTELTMDWKNLPTPGWSLYGWYYMTQALFQGTNGTGNAGRSGTAHSPPRSQRNQDREGFWLSPVDKYARQWADARERKAWPVDPKTGKHTEALFTELNSKIWATTMCTAYARSLLQTSPSFKITGHAEAATTPKETKEDDLTL